MSWAVPSTRRSRASSPNVPITLVRNDHGLVPLALPVDARIAVVQSRRRAPDAGRHDGSRDTDSWRCVCAGAERGLTSSCSRSIRRAQRLLRCASASPSYDLVVVGTAAAHLRPEQAALAQRMLEANPRTICVALRTPWDLGAYPERAHIRLLIRDACAVDGGTRRGPLR